VRQLNKYDFHKIKYLDGDPQKWGFRHPDFRENHLDALQNIKRKTERKTTPSAESITTSPLADSSHELEIQNIRIDSLEAQLTSLGAAHEDALLNLRTLERVDQKVLVEMVSVQRAMVQRDELLGLIRDLRPDRVAGERHSCRYLPRLNVFSWKHQAK